jgi:sec-independent protein translocase protein TatA
VGGTCRRCGVRGESVLKSLGVNELLVIFAIAAFLFGGKRIPEFAKGIGDGLRNFKQAIRETNEVKKEVERV